MKQLYPILAFCLSLANGLLLDLFAEKDRHGMSIRVEVSDTECSTLPVAWSSKASSVNTLGACIQLYDEPLCKGSLTILQPFHTIHQMDLSLINFAGRIQSASVCGAKVNSGRYVIQNAADASVLTVSSKYGGFARAFTVNASSLIKKAQQWDVAELAGSEYSLKPREFGDNYPVSYDEEELKKGKIVKKLWKLSSVGRGRYLIKAEKSLKCLYMTEEHKVEEHDCRVWSPNQEWVFKEIFGNHKSSQKSSSASKGPGLNYNILSKVASYIPPAKPVPEFAPIFYNATSLAKLKRRQATPAPYTVTKKIRRGPRPVSKPIPQLLSYIRPPGVRERPAIATKVANNNKFLLLKAPSDTKTFVPSDDAAETYAYYQKVLVAQKKHELELAEIREQLQKHAHGVALQSGQLNLQNLPPFPPSNKNTLDKVKPKKPQNEESDESQEDESQEDDEDNTVKKTITITYKKKRRPGEKKTMKVHVKTVENDEGPEKSEEDDRQKDSEEDSEEEDKPKKKTTPRPKPPPTPPPPTGSSFNPYEINYLNFDPNNASHTGSLQDEVSPGFFSNVYDNLKSLVPSVPFLGSGKDEVKPSQEDKPGQHQNRPYQDGRYPHHYDEEHMRPPPRRRRPGQHREHDPDYRDGPPDYEYDPRPHHGHGLRLPKRKSSTTTTTEKSSGLLGFLG